MKKIIVTTTINHPTEAIQAFDAMKDWTLIVAGDRKTPKTFELERGIYLTPDEQECMDKDLSDCIGWNSIQRRNFAFLMAHKLSADIVATIDDDNVPLPGWGENLLIGQPTRMRVFETDEPAFDPISVTNHPQYWHRGFPLSLVASRAGLDCNGVGNVAFPQDVTADIQADFWNGDPDVDAVCRMIYRPECGFEPLDFPFAADKLGPFNSQNTFLRADVLKHYFMFPGVGRMDDIWPSYYVQALRYKVVWNKASVYQRRPNAPVDGGNPNAGGGGLIANMKGEYLGYEHNLDIVRRLPHDPEAIWEYCPGRTKRAFDLYQKHFK